MKTVLPHLHSVATIAQLVGLDLSTKSTLKGSAGVITDVQIKEATTIAKHMPSLQLSAGHLAEVKTQIGAIVDYVQPIKGAFDKSLMTDLVSELTDSSNKLVAHNSNGAGDHKGLQPGAAAPGSEPRVQG